MRDLLAEYVGRTKERVTIELKSLGGSAPLSREQLEHLFRNLISNSIEHNPQDKELRIEIGEADARGVTRFYVRDDGRGIPASILPNVFLPFRRGLESSPVHLGLGLALVESIVSSAGGSVTCESEPGRSTTFWIEFHH